MRRDRGREAKNQPNVVTVGNRGTTKKDAKIHPNHLNNNPSSPRVEDLFLKMHGQQLIERHKRKEGLKERLVRELLQMEEQLVGMQLVWVLKLMRANQLEELLEGHKTLMVGLLLLLGLVKQLVDLIPSHTQIANPLAKPQLEAQSSPSSNWVPKSV